MLTFKRMHLYLAVVAFFSVTVAQGQRINKDSLDTAIRQLMTDFEVPAMSVAIVKGTDVVYLNALGTKTKGKQEPVDENTLFGIGSISKSITALSLGMLVDEGKIKWDDKVTDYLPYFQMYAPEVTNAFTIRDLMTHKSGLKPTAGGLLWYGSDLNREQVIRKMKDLPPVSEFRTTAAYQNLTFVAGGEIVAVVTGQSWDDFIKERLFKPLGMNHTFSRYQDIVSNKNITTPHSKDAHFSVITVAHRNHDNIGPAGSIYSTAKDMAQYMKLMLNKGVINGDTLVREKTMEEILKPHTFFPIFPKPIHNEFSSYAFGWWVTPKNGHKVVEHSGGVDGMVANLEMVTDKKFGIIALSNTEEPAAVALTLNMVGQAIQDPSYQTYQTARKSLRDKKKYTLEENRKKVAATRVKGTKPLNFASYTGTFRDKMYGDIEVKQEGKKLVISFTHTPSFTADLSHWHYNTFELNWRDPMVPKGFVTFTLNAKGEVAEMKFEQPNMLDVDFTELGQITKVK
ncbi:serine hydrolase [Rufibacter roseus]|uniref:Serine hydrolase n=1 Tax=Rufibacter roseus TaxID=1567108 RepID=A0ABW2DI52_9BACT|nr:serine hydrolase [Rufibacter roseus]